MRIYTENVSTRMKMKIQFPKKPLNTLISCSPSSLAFSILNSYIKTNDWNTIVYMRHLFVS